MHLRTPVLLASVLISGVATATVIDAPVEARSTTLLDIDYDPLGTVGSLGLEYNADGLDPYGGYGEMVRWDASGNWLTFDHELGSATFGHPTANISDIRVPTEATYLRLESYSSTAVDCAGDSALDDCYWEGYDIWNPRHGSFHLQLERDAGQPWPTIGTVVPPTPGDRYGGFVSRGRVIASDAITEGRLHIDAFQIDCSIYETCDPPPITSAGIPYGAFASGASKGDLWTMGVTWPGHYTVFIEDRDTGVKVQGVVTITAGPLPVIDLDAPCFGLLTCVTVPDSAAVDPPAAEFHPVDPVRILDTRKERGLTGGMVRPGDGRLDTTNAELRAAEVANHELTVTGVAGIPSAGVSAVLLNVTAVDPTGEGYVTVGPRPAGTGDVFDDQNSFGDWPDASNINIRAGVDTPNMVLVRVGAGGRIRFHVFGAETHLLADVAGWYSSIDSASDVTLTGFTPVNPARLLDTRGEPSEPLSGGTTTELRVTSKAGVPGDAEAVVLNVTAVSPSGSGFVTVYPSGGSVPDVSNLNLTAGVTRPNLVVVSVGDNGSIAIRPELAATHVLVDVFGYFAPESGGATTTATPFRVADSRNGIGTSTRPWSTQETRRIRIVGVGDVPAEATAVIANITVVGPTGEGFLTAWPSGLDAPNVSNLNFTSGEIIPNMAIIGLGDSGAIDVRVDLPWDPTGTAHVLVDVLGWVS